MRVSKYSHPLATATDVLCYVSTYPFLLAVSSVFSCYHTTSEERGRSLMKAFHFVVLGPALILVAMASVGPYLMGQVLWVALCHCPWVSKTDFARVDLDDGGGEITVSSDRQNEFTLLSANLLLGFDYLGKSQNMNFVYSRLWRIMEVFKRYNESETLLIATCP